MVASYYNTPVVFDGSFGGGSSYPLLSNDFDFPLVITQIDVVGSFSFKAEDLSDTSNLQNNYISCCGIFETGSFPGTNGQENTAGWLWYEALPAGTGIVAWPTTTTTAYVLPLLAGNRRWRGQVLLPSGQTLYYAFSYNSSADPTPPDTAFSGNISVFYDSVP